MSARKELGIRSVRELVNAKEADIDMAFAFMTEKVSNGWHVVEDEDMDKLAIDDDDINNALNERRQ